MAAHMRRSGYVPAAILCSTARRTRETLALVLPALGRQPDIRYEDALYLAEWGALLKAIQRSADAVSPLLLVGHNPGLEQLAAALAAQPASRSEGERLERLTGKFPTAALAVLDFEAKRWRDIRRATGRLTDFVCPKDLTGADGDG